jgi:hypothetical protein
VKSRRSVGSPACCPGQPTSPDASTSTRSRVRP